MLGILLILFILLPLVELTLLLFLASATDPLFTLGLVLVTGVIGSMLARNQGFATYRRIQSEFSSGRVPTDSLFDAVLIFVAGVLLITPGILTDMTGFALLVPFLRTPIKAWLIAWAKKNFHVATATTVDGFTTTASTSPHAGSSEILDSYVVESRKED
ncbi:FxsA family protein [Blastopirellula sp. JC732]|uniref:FxsA family protein n=1 Tax=Blastopirellula sediminis TaxID=2894196 RepID=A0A9X1MN55_9BACT|nr:FxsA family protein [Blastopirellula sediminis]MCC9607392.1 FxsA family protein [Blastopirellula sediminis]MCC9629315.1 FxsA family protein [Blastopirellula sediminis]